MKTLGNTMLSDMFDIVGIVGPTAICDAMLCERQNVLACVAETGATFNCVCVVG